MDENGTETWCGVGFCDHPENPCNFKQNVWVVVISACNKSLDTDKMKKLEVSSDQPNDLL